MVYFIKPVCKIYFYNTNIQDYFEVTINIDLIPLWYKSTYIILNS